MSWNASARALRHCTVLLLLAGCTSIPAGHLGPQSPRRDLDVLPRKIDPLLLDALDYPYRAPAPLDCPTLSAEIARLDQALGLDLDDPNRPKRDDHAARRLAVSGIHSAIPYFGWLRRLTGADRRQRLMQSAFAAGAARRGFLKGMGAQLGCGAPAAPLPPPSPPLQAAPSTPRADR